MKSQNTLVIPDLHLPFTHRHFLEFCKDTQRHYRCDRVVSAGDLVDSHATSFHDHDPDGMSPKQELDVTRKELKKWQKAFPEMDVAIGNHDEIARRKAYAHGLPAEYLRSFPELYGIRKWRFGFEFIYDTTGKHPWRLRHGAGTSGHDAAFKQAMSGRISTVQGHIHTAAGVKHHASSRDIIWGLQVGCGIDRKAYAFNYGRDFLDKPILGCGVVLENGAVPMFVPMPL